MFAECCVFGKQSGGTLCCNLFSLESKSPHLSRHTLYRRYGAILQSSLTRVIPHALEFSSYLPVSVCGTSNHNLKRFRNFSRHDGINDSLRYPKVLKSLSGLGLMLSGFTYSTTYALRATIPSVTSFSPMRPSFISIIVGIGILTDFPSPTPLGLGLGPD